MPLLVYSLTPSPLRGTPPLFISVIIKAVFERQLINRRRVGQLFLPYSLASLITSYII